MVRQGRPARARVGLKREHATYHATWHATSLAWPLLALLALRGRGWDDPLLVLIMAALLAMFVLYMWAMYKVERSLNAEGESLFYPWRVRNRKRDLLLVDDALSDALHRLARGDEADDIAWNLQFRTRDGRMVPEGARGHYDKAVARMENSRGRDRETRDRVLGEAEKWMWAARAEYLREMIE